MLLQETGLTDLAEPLGQYRDITVAQGPTNLIGILPPEVVPIEEEHLAELVDLAEAPTDLQPQGVQAIQDHLLRGVLATEAQEELVPQGVLVTEVPEAVVPEVRVTEAQAEVALREVLVTEVPEVAQDLPVLDHQEVEAEEGEIKIQH